MRGGKYVLLLPDFQGYENTVPSRNIDPYVLWELYFVLTRAWHYLGEYERHPAMNKYLS